MILRVLKPKTKRIGNNALCSCDWCKKKFIGKHSEQTRRDKKLHFCSRFCYMKYKGVPNNNVSYKNGGSSYRKLYERHYGVKLDLSTVIHHINGDRTDNRIENLIAMTFGEHIKYHSQMLRK